MSADPNILQRYTAQDHRSRESARAAHYDLLRETGYSADRARLEADRAVDQQLVTLDRALDPTGKPRGTDAAQVKRSKFRVPFPWESQE